MAHSHHPHPAPTGLSLLRAGLGLRLVGATAIAALIWLGVAWALH